MHVVRALILTVSFFSSVPAVAQVDEPKPGIYAKLSLDKLPGNPFFIYKGRRVRLNGNAWQFIIYTYGQGPGDIYREFFDPNYQSVFLNVQSEPSLENSSAKYWAAFLCDWLDRPRPASTPLRTAKCISGSSGVFSERAPVVIRKPIGPGEKQVEKQVVGLEVLKKADTLRESEIAITFNSTNIPPKGLLVGSVEGDEIFLKFQKRGILRAKIEFGGLFHCDWYGEFCVPVENRGRRER